MDHVPPVPLGSAREAFGDAKTFEANREGMVKRGEYDTRAIPGFAAGVAVRA